MNTKSTNRTENKRQEQLEAATLATRANQRDPFPLREFNETEPNEVNNNE
jgi:hypothetical protein